MKRRPNQRGFTIIELMIATTVFSTILLLCAAALIQVARLYYKGVNTARTQETARTVMDEISRSLQFSGEEPLFDPGTGVLCLGTQRYTFTVNKQLTGTGGHVLWRDTLNSGESCVAADMTQANPSGTIASNGEELMSPNMRLTRFDVNSTASSLYNIHIWVAFGDEDLLTAQDAANYNQRLCRGGAGSQFCAVSELSTVVQRRLR